MALFSLSQLVDTYEIDLESGRECKSKIGLLASNNTAPNKINRLNDVETIC